MIDKISFRTAARAVVVFLAANLAAHATTAEEMPDEAIWQWMQSNLLAQERILEISEQARPADIRIFNVNIVQLPEGRIQPDGAVIVKNGKIDWVGPSSALPPATEEKAVDANGAYLMPGLTDMHVHTNNDADYLSQLSVGVTSIREMAGDDWLLRRRDAVNQGLFVAPSMFVTSPILNGNDFGGYAIAVTNPAEARAEVTKAVEAGYDAIKIHNFLSADVLRAIVDASDRANIKVVGHIPVGTTVAEAIEMGLHTAEHFKGYIDDSRLQISEEDWVAATRGAQIYLTPTFYTYREHLTGQDAEQIIRSDGPLVPPYRVKYQWASAVTVETDALTRLRQTILPKSEEIFKALLPLDVKWLAGTDSGSYRLMAPGHALIEELETMERFGLSTLETLKAATTNAADAMEWSDRTGRIAPGLQADFILLKNNPLETVRNLRSPQGVMVRGIWFQEPGELQLNTEDYTQLASGIESADLEAAVTKAETISSAGYVMSSVDIVAWAKLMARLGRPDLAERLNELSAK